MWAAQKRIIVNNPNFNLIQKFKRNREAALLVPENEALRSSAAHSERVALVIAHELAHQWFGNLVTMRWWSDLWLKEGFATYMSYLALNYVSVPVYVYT